MQSKLSGSLARSMAAAVLLVVASSRCATYENNPPDGAGAGTPGSGGTGGESAAGGKPSTAGTPAASGSTSGSPVGGQQNGGSPSLAGASGSGEPGDGGASSGEGGAPSEGGQPPSGGMAGKGGTGGAGGVAGTSGMAGMAGMGGTGGGTPVLLSQGKTATSDSEETAKNNVASHANDGDTSTRWCAANNGLNHYWHVDLGQSRTLTKVHLLWEKNFAYLFKIETSTDNNQWSMAVDKTTSSSATASQDHTLPANTKGRYVRITVTGGLDATTWASLFEAQVFGY